MIRRIRVDALRGKLSSYAKGCLSGLESAIKREYPGSRIVTIETESPMSVTEELEIRPPTNSATAVFSSAMQATVEAWEAMTEAERIEVGYTRYFFHPNGSVQVQPITDPRKAAKRSFRA